jgi:hypothetical protein
MLKKKFGFSVIDVIQILTEKRYPRYWTDFKEEV